MINIAKYLLIMLNDMLNRIWKPLQKKATQKKLIVAGIFTCNKIPDNITETFLNKPIVLYSVAMVLVEFQHWCKVLFLKV